MLNTILSKIISPCIFQNGTLHSLPRKFRNSRLLFPFWKPHPICRTAGDAAFSNKQRYPTVLILGPTDQATLALAAHHFLDTFRWTVISLICDRLSKNVASTGFSGIACTNIQKRLTTGSGKFRYTVHVSDFDPADNTTFRSILQKVKSQSRGQWEK